MRKNELFVAIVLFCLVIFGLTSCGRQTASEEVIAEVGEEKIFREDFDISFILNPQYAIRTPLKIARQSQIDFLVNQKYYFLAARKADFLEDPVVQNCLEYIKQRESIRGYIQKKFLDSINLNDEELLKAYQRLGTKVRVQHLFTENQQEADSLWELLSLGESFESIAKKIYRDSSLSETGGDLGYIGFGDFVIHGLRSRS